MDKRTTLLGLKSLLHDAVDATVGLVRNGHQSASRSVTSAGDVAGIGAPLRSVEKIRMGATEGVLRAVTAVNRSVEKVTDTVIDVVLPGKTPASTTALPLRDDVALERDWWSDALIGGLNGAVGDHLARRGNPLGTEMVLRNGERYVVPSRCDADAFADLERVAVFVHGLASTEWSWVLGAEQSWGDPATSFGTLLQRDFGITPLYVRYNTGRTIAENGAALADLLDQFQRRGPNLRSIELFGHSMGGLVARQACLVASRAGSPWTELVDHVFYLGSPHRGAPLARVARGVAGVLGSVDLPATQIIANIIDGRSEGIKDLADGLDPSLLLQSAQHTFVSGTVTRDPEHPVGWVLGDLMVRRASAQGDGLTSDTIPVARAHSGGVLHHEIQNHPAVYEVVRRALVE